MSFDGIKRAALQRITAGSEGARLIGSQLAGYTSQHVQGLLAELAARVLPSGGTTDQVLKKTSGTDYAASWQAESATTPASETASGVAEIATQTETNAGTDDTRIVTPLKLATRTALDTRAGVVELATDAETQTGTDTARAITPANLSARSATETRTGVAEIATQTETDTGTDDARIVTPLKARNRLQVADLFSDFVVSGFNPSLPGATLTMTTPAGIAYIGGSRVSIAADTSRAYTASRDTYLDVNASGTYTAVAVTNGAAEPAVTASSLRILKVVTNATQVTAITQRSRATHFPSRLAKGAFVAYQSSAQTPTAAAITKVNLQSEEYDLDNWFDSTTNYRYTPQQAGFYFFNAAVNTITSGTGQSYLLCWLYKNGVRAKAGSASYVSANSFGLSAGGGWFIYANGSSDYFELYVQAAGTALTTGSDYTFLSGVYLGASPNIPGP